MKSERPFFFVFLKTLNWTHHTPDWNNTCIYSNEVVCWQYWNQEYFSFLTFASLYNCSPSVTVFFGQACTLIVIVSPSITLFTLLSINCLAFWRDTVIFILVSFSYTFCHCFLWACDYLFGCRCITMRHNFQKKLCGFCRCVVLIIEQNAFDRTNMVSM